MAALAMAGHTLLGYDVVFPVFAGGTHEAEALGVPVRWGDQGHMPACEKSIWQTADDIVIPDDFLNHPAISTPVKAIQILKREIGLQVETKFYTGDRATGSGDYGVYFLKSKLCSLPIVEVAA